MRRTTIMAASLLAILAAMPGPADARSRGFPGILGAITSPFRAVLGTGRHHHRTSRLARHRSHNRTAARPVTPAAAAATAALPAAGAVAATQAAGDSGSSTSAGLAHQPDTPESAPKAVSNVDQPAKPTTDGNAGAASDAAPSAAPPAAVTEGPPPAPPQRNAALSSPRDELRGGMSETPKPSQPAGASGHLGRIGPLTWPTAYEDVLGYALWPERYGDRLRGHGIADVLGSVFVAPSTLASKGRPTASRSSKADDSAAVSDGACSTNATSSDWPAAEIERAIKLTPPQKAALDQLKSTIGKTMSTIAATCRDTSDMSPVERLHALQASLWAVHDGALLIRAPLAAFYDSLSGEQQRQLVGTVDESAAPQPMSDAEMARLCGMPASLDASMRQIERSLHVTKGQRASLDALNKRSFEMGQFLMASCLKPIPATPVERLDSAADRLTTVLFAASNIAPSIDGFYAQLNDEQKTKLKTLR